jgi:uncharacterized membrane protein
MAHHGFFHRLRYVDRTLMRLNLALLAVVAFLPFPTALMAEALDVSRAAERMAVVVYGTTLVTINVLALAAARHAVRHEVLQHEPGSVVAARPSFPGYAIAAGVGLVVLPRIAVFAFLAIALAEVATARGES